MLKKDLLITKKESLNWSVPIQFTVGKDSYSAWYGYSPSLNFGSLSRVPFWERNGDILQLTELKFSYDKTRLVLSSNNNNSMYEFLHVKVSDYQTSFNLTSTGYTDDVKGDPLNLIGLYGQTVTLQFSPPLQDTCKKVNTVFTSSLKEGVVNAKKRNAFIEKRYCERHGSKQNRVRSSGYCVGNSIHFRMVSYRDNLWTRITNVSHEYSLRICRGIIHHARRNFPRDTCECESGRGRCKNNRLNSKRLRRSGWKNPLKTLHGSESHA